MSRDELLGRIDELEEKLSRLEGQAGEASRHALIHDLEVHQVELEAQNHELRQMQERLEASRERFADLFDFAPVAYLTLDHAGAIVDVNLTCAALLGRDRARIKGMLANFVEEEDRPILRRHLARARHGRDVAELRVSGPAGTAVAVEVVSQAFHREDRGWLRVAMVDVSQRKAAAEALASAIRMRDAFLAIVTHDLRSPLHAIGLSTEILLTGASGVERRQTGRRQLEGIQRSVDHMTRLISDLLDLASMDSGSLSVELAEYPVAEIVQRAVDNVRPQMAAGGIRFSLRVADGLPPAVCDSGRMAQALINVLGNAVKFTPPGGRIEVEVVLDDDCLRFAVSDSGPGIAADDLTHIFDPYWQASRTSGGKGLGLAIARGIIDRHRGTIWAESPSGGGTTFFFTCPAAASGAARHLAHPAGARDSGIFGAIRKQENPTPPPPVVRVGDDS